MPRRTAAFFVQRREWSVWKHQIFAGYATQFSRILGSDRGLVYLVDGFAGRGVYGEPVNQDPGSPLLAAQIAQRLSQQGQYKLRCINVEADRDEFRNLTANTAAYSDCVENRFGTLAEHMDNILETIGTRPTLFFLDPFGVGGLDWQTLSKIGHRRRSLKTELLINFNSPMFDRHAGWIDSVGQPPRDAFMDLLTRTVGSEDWTHIFDTPAPAEQRIEAIERLYLERMCGSFDFGGATYPVRTVDTQQLKYHVLFATRSELALRIMSSIFYGVERRYLRARTEYLTQTAPAQLPLELYPREPTVEELEERLISELRADVLELGRQRRRMRFDQLQNALMNKWFGRLVEKHYRRVCRELIEAGVIVRDWPTGIQDDTLLIFRDSA